MVKLRISRTAHTSDVNALLSLREVGVTSKFSHFTSLGSGAWDHAERVAVRWCVLYRVDAHVHVARKYVSEALGNRFADISS